MLGVFIVTAAGVAFVSLMGWLSVRAEQKQQSPKSMTCGECAALIDYQHEHAHIEWHERLRKAVDETGMLA